MSLLPFLQDVRNALDISLLYDLLWRQHGDLHKKAKAVVAFDQALNGELPRLKKLIPGSERV